MTAAHRSHHSTGISGTVGAPDTPQKSGNLCAVVGFAVMFPVGARRPAGHSTGGGTPASRTCPTCTSRFAGRWALPWIALASECPASAIPGVGCVRRRRLLSRYLLQHRDNDR